MFSGEPRNSILRCRRRIQTWLTKKWKRKRKRSHLWTLPPVSFLVEAAASASPASAPTDHPPSDWRGGRRCGRPRTKTPGGDGASEVSRKSGSGRSLLPGLDGRLLSGDSTRPEAEGPGTGNSSTIRSVTL